MAANSSDLLSVVSVLHIASFNCRGINTSLGELNKLFQKNDIIGIQEHWLNNLELDLLSNINLDFRGFGVSPMDPGPGMLTGRPYGGLGIIWRKTLDNFISQIKTECDWMCGISVKSSDREFVLLCVYLPYESPHNVDEYINCLAALETCIQEVNTATVYIVGDFNVDFQRNAHCTTLLRDFVSTNDLIISDCVFNKNVFSYISDAWSTTSWLDHCISGSDAHRAIKSAWFLDDYISSDHIPLCFSIEFNIIPTYTHKTDNVHGSSFIKHNWATASKRAI